MLERPAFSCTPYIRGAGKSGKNVAIGRAIPILPSSGFATATGGAVGTFRRSLECHARLILPG